ncbi:MAG TPA: hypothetical protein GXX50_06890 [Firmicutes bacterium]|nr:hypothetical protein [Bacillota bacterium]
MCGGGKVRVVVWALVLCLCGVFGPAAAGAALPGAETAAPAGAPAGLSERLQAAQSAFRALFKRSLLGSPGVTTVGLSYPEKEALRSAPPADLLAAIGAGLKGVRSDEEAFFWFDLLTLLPDRQPGAAAALLGFFRSGAAFEPRFLNYQVTQAHLARFLSAADAEELIDSLGEYEPGLQYNLITVLKSCGYLTRENSARLLRQPGVDPLAVLGQLEPITEGKAPAGSASDTFAWLGSLFPSLPVQNQTLVARWVGQQARWANDPAAQNTARAWLKVNWARAKEPAVRQELCYQLYWAADVHAALDQLAAEVEKHGAARGLYFWGDQDLLRRIRADYPASYLARGFAAYEKVRGRPYFVLDFWDPNTPGPWPFKYGDTQYDPAREIPGWHEFLRDFSRHPGADDAAYRLARCYEIEGKWGEALTWYARALTLPDGDMDFDARGRLFFVLDARIPAAALRELPLRSDVAPELGPLAAYTLAVRELQAERYREAAAGLAEFLKKYGPENPSAPKTALALLPDGRYPFWQRVKEQQEQAARLADLAARPGDPEALYALGAAVYHNELTYYNHLWAGERQGFNWVGHINELWPEVPEREEYLEGLMNFWHARRYFQAAERAPQASPDLKAKALYSQGLALGNILEWGQEATATFDQKALKQELIATFQRFVATYPASSLADDALFALWAYTQDRTYLERLVAAYPDGDRAGAAKKLLGQPLKTP